MIRWLMVLLSRSAGTVALKNGMTVKKLFAQLKEIKEEVQLPLVLMGYLNPIMHYGIEAFLQELRREWSERHHHPRPSL